MKRLGYKDAVGVKTAVAIAANPDLALGEAFMDGTLTIAANNGEDVYSDASSLTASIKIGRAHV